MVTSIFCTSNFNVDDSNLSVCLSVCVCPSQAIPRNLLVTIVKLGTVNASDMPMHHLSIILTLTFIQDLNNERKKSSIISEIVQAIPIKCAVATVRLKVYLTIASQMTLIFILAHKCITLDYFLTCNISDNIKLLHSNLA